MEFIFEGIKKGILLIISFDSGVFTIVKLSLFVSFFATFIAVLIGLPMGAFISVKEFPLKKIIIALINTGMGMPPVVVGLIVTLFLFRSGPLGALHWLYTPQGMILAQVIIATPIVTGLTLAAFQSVEKRFYLQILALGANTVQALYILLKEIRLSVLAAVIAGFGSVISEVGAVMMVGGNIKGQTRVLTTATVIVHSLIFCDLVFVGKNSINLTHKLSALAKLTKSMISSSLIPRIGIMLSFTGANPNLLTLLMPFKTSRRQSWPVICWNLFLFKLSRLIFMRSSPAPLSASAQESKFTPFVVRDNSLRPSIDLSIIINSGRSFFIKGSPPVILTFLIPALTNTPAMRDISS